jgi:hypothetical protein
VLHMQHRNVDFSRVSASVPLACLMRKPEACATFWATFAERLGVDP